MKRLLFLLLFLLLVVLAGPAATSESGAIDTLQDAQDRDGKIKEPTPGVATLTDYVFRGNLPTIQVLSLSLMLSAIIYNLMRERILRIDTIKNRQDEQYKAALASAAGLSRDIARYKRENEALARYVANLRKRVEAA